MPGHEPAKARNVLKAELKQLADLIVTGPPPSVAGASSRNVRRLPTIGAACESGGLATAVHGNGKPVHHQQQPLLQLGGAAVASSLSGGSDTGGVGGSQIQPEIQLLMQFSLCHQNERSFAGSDLHDYYAQLFNTLLTHRLFHSEWIGDFAPPENMFRVLNVLRILMRDAFYQKLFADQGGLKVLAHLLRKTTHSYMNLCDGPFIVEILQEITNIFQKLASSDELRRKIAECGAHEPLVLLLSSRDAMVLHCTLYALLSLSQSHQLRSLIEELNCIEKLLIILHDYDDTSQRVAANLLKVLCTDSQAREMVKVYDGIPVLLGLLRGDKPKLMESIVWCIVKLSEDEDTSNDLRHMGVIPLLLSLLPDRSYSSEYPTIGTAPASASNLGRTMGHPLQSLAIEEEDAGSYPVVERESSDKKLQAEKMIETQLLLKAACCAALAELGRNDHNAQQIMEGNGVYLIATLLLPVDNATAERARRAAENLQRHSARTLRFLFSMERNRRPLMRLFKCSTELIAKFVDIGHYVKDIAAYRPVVEKLNSMPESALAELSDTIMRIDQNRAATQFIGEYAVLEHLGSGSFGCVYKVRKQSASQSFFALKEVNLQSSSKGSKDRGDASELPIMREQLKHPNIVKYHKTFVENDKLYIVMELIEGAPIGEHFVSLKEKGQRFSEERIWNIVVQMVLALRYLHKEKSIVHRDLSPNNIMLGENDKVTITDFGLAKQQSKEDSKLRSVVGTLLYSCPEIIQNMPYGEKADIWAMGCLVYQMCTLHPPFHTSNMLSLAKQIVSGEYEPIADGDYSGKLKDVIRSCLTVCPESRPDIVEVAALIANRLLHHIEKSRARELSLEKKLDKERKRTQRHFSKAHSYMQNYHRLCVAHQEQAKSKLNASVTDSGSGVGAGSTNECDASDCFLSDSDAMMTADGKRRHVSADSQDSNASAPSRRRPRCGRASDDQNNNRVVLWLSNEDDGDRSSSSGADSRESSSSGSSLRLMKRSDSSSLSRTPRPLQQLPPLTSRVVAEPSHHHHQQPLLLEIPPLPPPSKQATRSMRDSGVESSEHSPCARNTSTDASGGGGAIGLAANQKPLEPSAPSKSTDSGFVRSISSPQLDARRTQAAAAAGNGRAVAAPGGGGSVRATNRPRSGSSGGAAKLTISPRKVRQISDPIQQMLNVLHKVIYITQLPPSLQYNPRRRLVEKFKRSLFAPQSSPANLKSELKKVLTSSADIVDLNHGLYEMADQLPSQASARHGSTDADDGDAELRAGVSYEQMLGIIETVLSESGYYDLSQQAQLRRTPLAPIAAATPASRSH